MNKNEKIVKYGLRKLSVGLVSCMLGFSLIFTGITKIDNRISYAYTDTTAMQTDSVMELANTMTYVREGNRLKWTVVFNPRNNTHASSGYHWFTLPTNVGEATNFHMIAEQDKGGGREEHYSWPNNSFGGASAINYGKFHTDSFDEAMNDRPLIRSNKGRIRATIHDIKAGQTHSSSVGEVESALGRFGSPGIPKPNVKIWQVLSAGNQYKKLTTTFYTDLPQGADQNFEKAMKKVSFVTGFYSTEGRNNNGMSHIVARVSNEADANEEYTVIGETIVRETGSDISSADIRRSAIVLADGRRVNATGLQIYPNNNGYGARQREIEANLNRLENRRVPKENPHLVPIAFTGRNGVTVRDNVKVIVTDRPTIQGVDRIILYRGEPTNDVFTTTDDFGISEFYAEGLEGKNLDFVSYDNPDVKKRNGKFANIDSDGNGIVPLNAQVGTHNVILKSKDDVGLVQKPREGKSVIVEVKEQTEKYTPVAPVNKLDLTSDPNNISQNDKNRIIQAIKEANRTNNQLPESVLNSDSAITVDAQGNATITYPDDSTDRITKDRLINPNTSPRITTQPSDVYLLREGIITSPIRNIVATDNENNIKTQNGYIMVGQSNENESIVDGIPYNKNNGNINGNVTAGKGEYTRRIKVEDTQGAKEISQPFKMHIFEVSAGSVNGKRLGDTTTSQDILNAVIIDKGSSSANINDNNIISKRLVANQNGGSFDERNIPTSGNNTMYVEVTTASGSKKIVPVQLNYAPNPEPVLKYNNYVLENEPTIHSTITVYKGEEAEIPITAIDEKGKIRNFKASWLPRGIWFNRQGESDPAISRDVADGEAVTQVARGVVDVNANSETTHIVLSDGHNRITRKMRINVASQSEHPNNNPSVRANDAIRKTAGEKPSDAEVLSKIQNAPNVSKLRGNPVVSIPDDVTQGNRNATVTYTYTDGSTDVVNVPITYTNGNLTAPTIDQKVTTTNSSSQQERTLTGRGTPGATVNVTIPGQNRSLTAQVQQNGTWSVPLPVGVNIRKGQQITAHQSAPFKNNSPNGTMTVGDVRPVFNTHPENIFLFPGETWTTNPIRLNVTDIDDENLNIHQYNAGTANYT